MTTKTTIKKILNTPKMSKHDALIATLSTASLTLVTGGVAMLMNKDAFGAILVTVGIVIIFVRQNLK